MFVSDVGSRIPCSHVACAEEVRSQEPEFVTVW